MASTLYRVKSTILFLALTTGYLTLAHAKDIRDCRSYLLPDVATRPDRPADRVYVNQVMVTGEKHYPLQTVLDNLDMGSASGLKSKIGAKTVLSVAEGFSGLLPAMKNKGLDAWGLDLWYESTNIPDNEGGLKMKEFIAENSERLIGGNALDMPVLPGSVDLLLNHMLVNNIPLLQSQVFLDEAVRVLAVNGEARIYGFEDEDLPEILRYLERNYGAQLQVSTRSVSTSYIYAGKPKTMSGQLLIFRRVSLNP